MFTENKIRNLIKIHGGKRYIMKHIVEALPKDYLQRQVWDVFGGGATCLLRSPKALQENYNDIDKGLYCLLKCVVSDSENFIKVISNIPYSEKSFLEYNEYKGNDLLLLAVREAVVRRMSRGGMMKAFSYSQRLRGGVPGDENAWNTWKQELPKIAERLKNVHVYNENGIELLKTEANHSGSFVYIDPPYYPETRVSKKVYAHEMTKDGHIQLLETMMDFKGKAIIMGYDCPLYRKMLKRWRLRTIPIANHSSQAKVKETKVECLWLNYKN